MDYAIVPDIQAKTVSKTTHGPVHPLSPRASDPGTGKLL